jgi:hypothetical protein
MYAYSPNGSPIVGTLETIPGTAQIQHGSFQRDKDGSLDFGWCGETDVFWDGQETVERDGKRVFVDKDGHEWTENQLKLRTRPRKRL